MKKDDLGNRMKDYENSYRLKLPKRMPVIIRLDGKSFHSYTKGLDKPFDDKLIEAFHETCKYLCENIIGCKVAYHQSDEISLLITNYDKLTTESWFDNNIQKMVSIASSLATVKFNQMMSPYTDKIALFDARAFVLSKEEVNNAFIWRQQDAIKNSISMVAHYEFGNKRLNKVNGKQKKELLLSEKNINFDKDIGIYKQRGACIIKENYLKGNVKRTRWVVDKYIPIFSEDNHYINRYVYLDDD